MALARVNAMTTLVVDGVRLRGRVAAIVSLLVTLGAAGCISGAGVREGSEDEIDEPTSKGESGRPRQLVYATRSDGQVTVSRRPLGPGEAEGLFTYEESDGRPDVAVSPDGHLIAYVVDGLRLHVRELAGGDDTISVEGEKQEPTTADAAPPRWSKEGMNYLTPQQQKDCPECGILAIGNPVFSPSGRWVAFEQRYYEGANWGLVERATGRYQTSGDLAGNLHWRSDREVVGVGAFYGEDASVRMADVDMLPETREVPMGDYRHFGGRLSPAGDDIALIATARNATAAPDIATLVVRSTLAGGPGAIIDNDGRKLTVGFTSDGTLLWVERRDLAADLLRESAAPTPLPDDLYRYDDMIAVGPRLVGVTGHTRPDCSQVAEPCQGPAPSYQQRFLLIDANDGAVVWQSPPIGDAASFGGVH